MQDSIPKNLTLDGFKSFAAHLWGAAAAVEMAVLYKPAGPDGEHGPGWAGAGNGWWLSATRVVGDYIMSCPSRRASRWITGWWKRRAGAANATAASSAPKLYMYNFDYAPIDQQVHQVIVKAGACHSCELPSVFNNRQFLHSAAEIEFATTVSAQWRAFATSANPSSLNSNDPEWPEFRNATSEVAAIISPVPSIAHSLFKGRCDLFDSLPYTDPH